MGARPHLRAARAAGRRSRWRATRCRSRSAATRAARSACRRRSAAPSASSRPTAGSASTGVWPLARTLDHPGPMARTPADAALLLHGDRRLRPGRSGDGATCRSAISTRRSRRGARGLPVGLCPDLHLVPLAPDVAAGVRRGRGAPCAELAPSSVEVALPEARAVLDDVRRHAACRGAVHAPRGRAVPGAGGRVRRRRARPARARRPRGDDATTSAPPRSAQRLRARLRPLFEEVDLLLTPVSAGSPCRSATRRSNTSGAPIEFRATVMSLHRAAGPRRAAGVRGAGRVRRSRHAGRRATHGRAWETRACSARPRHFGRRRPRDSGALAGGSIPTGARTTT